MFGAICAVVAAVIPIVVIVGAIGMTQIYPDRARDKARAQGAA